MDPLRERLRDLRRGHNRAQRRAVSDAFRHANDIWYHPLRLETPVMRAASAEPRLHFIRNADAARCPDVFVSVLEVAVRKPHATADTLDRFRDEPGDLPRRRII